MRQTAATAILTYWQSIAPESGVPQRTAIEPKALKSYLPDLFILERLDRAVFAFRLAGTRLCARYGRELRDHDFVRLWPLEQHGRILEALNACLQTPGPVKLSGVAATLDNATVTFDVLLMPIADANGVVSRVLGAMLPANDLALRDGAILVSQTLDQSGTKIGVTADAFAVARETKVSFLRVIDGARTDRPAPVPDEQLSDAS